MQVFNLREMKSFPYAQRDKNVFFEAPNFKARIIHLAAGESIPECRMASDVIFTVIDGSVEITVNGEKNWLNSGHCLITEPALISMTTESAARVMGIQIKR
ncbi:MAG: hypothetical protein Kow0042_08610 [Calditrichia bacterium]